MSTNVAYTTGPVEELAGPRMPISGGVRLIRTRLCLDIIAALYAGPRPRHSASAAVRLSLKFGLE